MNYNADQISIFDILRPEIRINKPIRLIELFAGYGSQALALKYIGADFEHYRVVEFDKYAVESYNAIHGTNFPVLDITKVKGVDLGIVDKQDYTYLLTYSFPCTDLSIAGRMAGMVEGSGTHSSLLWEVKRLLDEVGELPQILLMENVIQVHSKDNIPQFRKWLDYLESKGYVSYMQDLNARDYGMAQNRERTFLISLLGNYSYKFPKQIPLNTIMKDYLENGVDDKYYLTNEKAEKLIDTLIIDGRITINGGGYESIDLSLKNPRTINRANCITARYDAGISERQSEGAGICEWDRIH